MAKHLMNGRFPARPRPSRRLFAVDHLLVLLQRPQLARHRFRVDVRGLSGRYRVRYRPALSNQSQPRLTS